MLKEIVVFRSPRPAGRSRPAGIAGLALAAGAALFVPAAANASGGAVRTADAIVVAASDDNRTGTFSWFADGQGEAAYALIDLLATSEIEGLDPRQFNVRALQRSVRRALGDPEQARAADRQLNEALTRYVAA